MKFLSRVFDPGVDLQMAVPLWEEITTPVQAAAPATLRPDQAARQPDGNVYQQAALPERDLLSEARFRATEILEEAEAAAQELLAEASARGYEEGQARARSEAEAELARARADLEAAVEPQRAAAAAELDGARREAETLRARAAREAEEVRCRAKEESAGIVSAARTEADDLLQQAWAELKAYLDTARMSVVELAMAVAARILQYELSVRPEAVAGLVAAGLERLRTEEATIFLSPADLPLLEARQDDLRRASGCAQVELRADRALGAGDFWIRSRHGEVDGRLGRQMDAIRQPIVRKLREAELP